MQVFPRSRNRENPTGIRDFKKSQQGKVSASGREESDQFFSPKIKLRGAAKASGYLHPIVFSGLFLRRGLTPFCDSVILTTSPAARF